MKVKLNVTKKSLAEMKHLVVVAPEMFYADGKIIKKELPRSCHFLLSDLSKFKSGTKGAKIESFVDDKRLEKVSLIVLPDEVSRSNSRTRKYFTDQLLSSLIDVTKESCGLWIVLEEKAHIDAMAASVARQLKDVSYKTAFSESKNSESKKSKKSSSRKTTLSIAFTDLDGRTVKATAKTEALVDSVRWSMALVDTAPSELNPEKFSLEIKKRFLGNSAVKFSEIVGKDLVKEKLGGIWAVGKTAVKRPRLVCLRYKPKGIKQPKKIALAGKGVTYDTGGLNLKVGGSMAGMKADMGGAAAVVSAFDHLVKSGSCRNEVIAVVGLVENAIGPEAYKPDDIVTMHSGKTVEINNTDAEGRLVLGDCVSWVARKFSPSVIVDAATLTGAQLVATGLHHAALVCSDDELEKKAVETGHATGDMVCPLPFAPDVHLSEFDSVVADMKNSVKNRGNAQTSCAGLFIYSQISDLPKIKYLHVDLAGPAVGADGRGTGFGTHLLSKLCH